VSVTGVATTDIFTATAHNFVNTDQVVFSSITGGAGITAGVAYYVISATTNTFQVSTTSGGAA
jgi:energy-converting hydrogenase Eha subunit G